DKINFFVRAAHDIRTPLTLIKAPLEEIISKEKESNNEISNLAIAVDNTNYLCKLISGISNFEIDKTASQTDNTEHELYAYLEEKVNQFIPESRYKNIHLSFKANFRHFNVWFDSDKMDSIVANLLSNAIKYTASYGSVEVIATKEQYLWKIEVKDSGIGIPLNEQNKLFKKFFRGQNTIYGKELGSGVGLMMTGKLIHQQKGKIKVKSIEGEGSSFEISFPFDDKKIASKQEKSIKKEQNAVINEQQPNLNNVIEKTSGKSRKPLILLVEDNYEFASFLKNSLLNDYLVCVACNGKQALEMMKEIKPILIISDYLMPEMKGDELCTLLKKEEKTAHIPIIMLTGYSETCDIFQSINSLVDMFITKPFDIRLLKARIKYLTTNKRIFKEIAMGTAIPEDPFISKVKNSIKQNMSDSEYDVADICKTLSVSRTSLYTKIKKLTGQSPNDFIRSQHLDYAAQLLKLHQYNINEVIDLSGFNDPKYFREVF
ncbi:MAG: response regulator, partial [Bacteroidaceae bacterium]